MCGIVGIGLTQSRMTEALVSWFESMLLHDIVRGPHATGVYRAQDGGISLYKDAIPVTKYLHTPQWEDLRGEDLTKFQQDALVRQGLPVPTPLSNFYVGHNRYATMGNSADPKNAHPFHEGNITLCHNGTLTGQWRLPDSAKFAVDSNNIAHSINTIGIDETVGKLQGAYTLVWHDAATQTLNFLRNSQRPLFMVELTSGGWIWCSEQAMFDWLNDRRKVSFLIKRSFELPINTQMIFDVADGKFELKEEVEHKPATFPIQNNYHYGNNNVPYGTNIPVGKPKNGNLSLIENKDKKTGESLETFKSLSELVSKTCESHDLSVNYGDVVQFIPFDFLPYDAITDSGRIRGYGIDENSNYYEAEAHGFTCSEYDEIDGIEIYGKVRSAMEETSVVGGRNRKVLILILSDIAYTSDALDPEVIEGEVDEVKSILLDGESSGLTLEEDAELMIESLRKEISKTEAEVAALESAKYVPGSTPTLPARKTLTDGKVALVNTWGQHHMSECGFCGKHTPWEDAETVQSFGNIPSCDTCYSNFLTDD